MESGFPPIEGARAVVLVLGTMPSERSLQEREYYAFPRNTFWNVMEAFGAGRDVPYEERCSHLKGAGIAVWDVLASCSRKGSLDKDIKNATPNDLAAFHSRHPELRAVFLNGSTAAKYFKRFVGELEGVQVRVMPSTSPALARKGKTEVWRQTLAEFLQLGSA